MEFNRLRESSRTHLARMAGFYLSVLAFLFMWLVIFGEGLVGVFQIWLDPAIAGTHFVHGATFMTMIWILGLAMLVQLYPPVERIFTMQLALLIPIISVIDVAIQNVEGTFDPMLLVFFAPIFVAAGLHPARGELVSRDVFSKAVVNWPLLGLAALALVPVGLYTLGQANLQLTLTDEHAVLSHYSTMATYSQLFVALAALAGIGESGLRGAAYSAAVMAVVLAAASLYQPASSAIDPTWSALALLWALAVVAAFEWTDYRTSSRRRKMAVEDPGLTP